MDWAGRKILLGITGSIAAYKATWIIRQLKSKGAEVQVVCSSDALGFVTPLTLATLSERPVFTEFVRSDQGEWVNHVALGLWADLMLIAPCSAHTLAKMAGGLCDNLLMAVYLSARCPVWFAPAMDLDMWKHPATSRNVNELISRPNHRMLGPASGALASGLSGVGRMSEPQEIVDAMEQWWLSTNDQARHPVLDTWRGRKVLITAGPTREAIDDVRYISNHSSGKMGYALAQAFLEQGAEVILISGPVSLSPPQGLQSFVAVESALEMHHAVEKYQEQFNVGIFCAAVADFRPAHKKDGKIKKQDGVSPIALVANPDILAEIGRKKRADQFLVGFALETENGLAEAARKKSTKHCDLLILNHLNDPGAGFGLDTNLVTLLSDQGITELPLAPKIEIARQIIQHITKCYLHS
jgi:phosphopantothenoylcysteine decarboxylase/phosphopantothenate--cysteine ligase